MLLGRGYKGKKSKPDQSWYNLKAARSRAGSVTTLASFCRKFRNYLRFSFLIIIVFLLGIFFYKFVFNFNDSKNESNLNQDTFLKKVQFHTDGVLNDQWLRGIISLSGSTRLMDIEIFKIKDKIEASNQIIYAEVRRQFPDTLKISVKEAVPKLKLNNNHGVHSHNLISKEGVVFKGFGYSESFIESLLFLIPGEHNTDKIISDNQLSKLMPLLDLIENSNLKDSIGVHTISLEKFSGNRDIPGQIIEIRSKKFPRILFTPEKDYLLQLERLNVIFSHLNTHGNPSVDLIDLSLMNHSTIRLKKN